MRKILLISLITGACMAYTPCKERRVLCEKGDALNCVSVAKYCIDQTSQNVPEIKKYLAKACKASNIWCGTYDNEVASISEQKAKREALIEKRAEVSAKIEAKAKASRVYPLQDSNECRRYLYNYKTNAYFYSFINYVTLCTPNATFDEKMALAKKYHKLHKDDEKEIVSYLKARDPKYYNYPITYYEQ